MENRIGEITRLVLVLSILLGLSVGCAKMGKVFEKKPPPEHGPAVSGEVGPQAPGHVEPGPGAEPATSPREQPEKVSYHLHTVQWPGESLSIIAAWYTGKLENWRALANANPKLNPNRIFQGNEIRIPVGLMKNREPMPQEFVNQFLPSQQKEAPAPEPQPQAEEDTELELFGPKE